MVNIVPALAGGLCAGLLALNTLQSGRLQLNRKYDVLFSPEKREQFRLDNFQSDVLSKKEFTQLFLRCQAPKTNEVTGVYDGYLLNMGVCAPFSAFISNRLFGPGEWAGKEFSKDDVGINRFTNKVGDSKAKSEVSKRFTCKVTKSVLDKKPVMLLDYAPYNQFDPIAWGMRDEIRKVDRRGDMLIGCGGLAVSGGVRNFAPFVLVRASAKKRRGAALEKK